MAKNTINDKSKQISIRIPHDVLENMDALKLQDESSAGFIVSAMRGEIARRKMNGTTEDAVASAIETIKKIRGKAIKLHEEMDDIIDLTNIKID
ncbi:YlcI/YnfO family protein [Enterobacter hormaechei]